MTPLKKSHPCVAAMAGGALFSLLSHSAFAAAPVINLSSPSSSSLNVALGSTVSLRGAVTDDGLPVSPGAVTTTWSMESGLGVVSFGDSASVDTTASFSIEGSYVIRLTAFDGQDTTTEDIAVEVGNLFSPSSHQYGGATGSHTITNGVYSINNSAGSGIDDGATSDGFYSLEQAVSGDFDLSCRIDSATDTSDSGVDYERVGLVLRGGSTPSDGDVSAFIGYDSTTVNNKWAYWATRSVINGANVTTVDNAGYSFPRYVRLARVGNTVTGYLSDNGTTWVSKGSTTLSGAARLGLVWASDSSDTGSAQFSDLQYAGSGAVAGNYAPVVDAGADATTGGSSYSLSGSVADDGLPVSPGATTTTWSLVSGPAGVTFSDASSLTSSVTLSAPGSYTLRLTASDGEVEVVDDMTLSYQVALPSNAHARYTASSGITLDGSGTITSWNEHGGTADRNLDTVLGSPTMMQLSRSGGGTAEVVNFDGSSGLWVPSSSWGRLTGSRTIVAYCRVTGNGDGFLFDGSAGNGKTRAQVSSGDWQVGVQASSASFSSADTATTAVSQDTWQTHIFTFSESGGSTQVTHFIDNVQVGSHSVATDTGLDGLIVAANGAASNNLSCQFAELVIYGSVLSASERTAAQDFMTATWGDLVDTPFEFVSARAVQTAANSSVYGINGIAALEMTSTGNAATYALRSVDCNLNGTTDVTDIEELHLYTTGSQSTFDVNHATLLGTVVSPGTGFVSFSVNSTIQHATEYFWLAAKMSGNSTLGDVLDAEIRGFSLDGDEAGFYTPSVTDPAGVITLNDTFFSTIVRAGGDDGVVSHRIPALVTTNAGTLIAAFDLRYNHAGDLPANIDVGIERSTDGGFTWGPLINIMDFDSSVAGSSGNGVGDPALLVDRTTGRIWAAALWSKGNNGWAGSGPGLNPDDTGQFVINYSDDDGLTWSTPVSITSSIKDPAWNLYFNGPGKGFTTRDGTLIFPAQYRDSGGTARSNFIYSVDNGATWENAPPAIASGNPATTEAQMVELDNGDLLISMRNHAGNGLRLWNIFSWDHATETIADGSWGTAWHDQQDPVVMASVERYRSTLDGHPYSALLFANPESTSREKMTVRLSLDEGVTWPYKRKIDDRQAGYSCLTLLPDGDIGLFYETGVTSSITQLEFARFPIEWLVGDTDTDSDGIPDFNEDVLGLDKNNGADAALDPDGDGQSSLAEYLAQTNPTAAGSVLKADITVASGGGLQVEWPTTQYTNYRVETSTSLINGSWTTVPGMESIRGTGGSLVRSMPANVNPKAFYRIVAE